MPEVICQGCLEVTGVRGGHESGAFLVALGLS